MANAYSVRARKVAYDTYKTLGLDDKRIHEGLYVNVAGPAFESPAEARFFRQIGGDVVGMSTVGEVTVARHCGMEVLGISLVTNRVAQNWDEDVVRPRPGSKLESKPVEEANHAEVLEMAQERAQVLGIWVESIVQRL